MWKLTFLIALEKVQGVSLFSEFNCFDAAIPKPLLYFSRDKVSPCKIWGESQRLWKFHTWT
jgi:hypothetical protein